MPNRALVALLIMSGLTSILLMVYRFELPVLGFVPVLVGGTGCAFGYSLLALLVRYFSA